MKSEKHRDWIRGLPCIICARVGSIECAHVRYSDARVAKKNSGIGAKPSDAFCLPMCNTHHRAQHAMGNERKFWEGVKLDPVLLSLALYHVSGDYEAGCEIIAAAQQ